MYSYLWTLLCCFPFKPHIWPIWRVYLLFISHEFTVNHGESISSFRDDTNHAKTTNHNIESSPSTVVAVSHQKKKRALKIQFEWADLLFSGSPGHPEGALRRLGCTWPIPPAPAAAASWSHTHHPRWPTAAPPPLIGRQEWWSGQRERARERERERERRSHMFLLCSSTKAW